MTIYYIVLFIVIILLSIKDKKDKPINYFVFLSTCILILFPTVRSSEVGTDTSNYVYSFNLLNVKNEPIFNNKSSLEIGYRILEKSAFYFSNKCWMLFLLIALIGVGINVIILKKLSLNLRLSIFIYVTLGSYLFMFNGARQALAASIYCIAVYYMTKDKLLYYLFWVYIASLFHNTAFLLLPFYFILRFEFTIKKMILFIVASFFAISFLKSTLSILDQSSQERYLAYENRGAQGGYLLALFFVGISIFLINFKNKISHENYKKFNIYLNICVFCSTIYLVVIITGADINLIRLSLYFLVGYTLIWPILYNDVVFFKSPAAKFLIFVVHLLFFGVYLSKMSNLTPFEFNENLF